MLKMSKEFVGLVWVVWSDEEKVIDVGNARDSEEMLKWLMDVVDEACQFDPGEWSKHSPENCYRLKVTVEIEETAAILT